ncbi:MAG: FAD binding domain-containing protein [Synergistaceae bacterium]|jgi:carbon-monoxide dehydrogenase medium subunit|nr:FAD binding domain-containing protein [Synergistaceae bacterium]
MIYEDPLVPSTMQELQDMMAAHAGKFLLAAGGTDLFVKRRGGIGRGVILIDLSGIGDLRGISVRASDNCLEIGAMETMTSVSENPLVIRHARCLAEAASKVGSWQIRNRATIGGNTANASPAADTPSALASLGAEVILVSRGSERRIPAEDISKATGSSEIAPNEIISAFRIPLRENSVSAFGKIGLRSEVSIARLNLAVSAQVSDVMASQITNPRVFAGTLGIPARRCAIAEDVLVQNGFGACGEFCRALAELVDEAIPGRSTQAFKRSAIQALGEDVSSALLSRLKGAVM